MIRVQSLRWGKVATVAITGHHTAYFTIYGSDIRLMLGDEWGNLGRAVYLSNESPDVNPAVVPDVTLIMRRGIRNYRRAGCTEREVAESIGAVPIA